MVPRTNDSTHCCTISHTHPGKKFGWLRWLVVWSPTKSLYIPSEQSFREHACSSWWVGGVLQREVACNDSGAGGIDARSIVVVSVGGASMQDQLWYSGRWGGVSGWSYNDSHQHICMRRTSLACRCHIGSALPSDQEKCIDRCSLLGPQTYVCPGL